MQTSKTQYFNARIEKQIQEMWKNFFDFCFVVSANRRTFAAAKTIAAYENK